MAGKQVSVRRPRQTVPIQVLRPVDARGPIRHGVDEVQVAVAVGVGRTDVLGHGRMKRNRVCAPGAAVAGHVLVPPHGVGLGVGGQDIHVPVSIDVGHLDRRRRVDRGAHDAGAPLRGVSGDVLVPDDASVALRRHDHVGIPVRIYIRNEGIERLERNAGDEVRRPGRAIARDVLVPTDRVVEP